MNDPSEREQDRRVVEWYQQSWCPFTWDRDFWGVALVLLGVGLVIAEVFNIDQFWEVAGGLLIAAYGMSLLRASDRRN